MAINPLLRSSPTRMMGLSSGMDTDSLIQQTLRIHQMRIDAQMRQRTILHWRQDTHNGIKDQITSFRNTFLSTLGSTTMMQKGVYNSTIATMNKTSNAISIAGTINSSVGTMKIGAIESLARGASVYSAGSVSSDKNGFSTSQRLDSMQFAGGGKIDFSNYQASVSEGGSNLKISQSDATDKLSAADWTSRITTSNGKVITLTRTGSGEDTQYKYSIDGETSKPITFEDGKFTIQAGEDEGEPITIELTQMENGRVGINGNVLAFTKEADVKAVAEDGTVTTVKLVQSDNGQIWHNGSAVEFAGSAKIKINDKEIELKSNMTLSQMMSAVNNTNGIGATMSYDRLTDSFKIESKTIGSSSAISVSDVGDGNALKMFGLDGVGPGSNSAIGSSAVVYINGEKVERDTNTFEYRGVKITLHGVKDGSTVSGTSHDDDITVTLKRDATDAVNRIKGFIEAYNSIIKRIEGLVRERKTSSEAAYGPLTDEEKSVMSEKQIADWEAIAKKGLLRNDSGLQNLASSLRGALYESVRSVGMSPSDIGLTTGNFFSGTGGQIVLDEDKLRAALEEDPDRVANIFAGTDENRGMLWRMNNIMGDYVNNSQTLTLKGLENSIKRANDQMTKMQARMYAEEDRLYKQFAAMETALSKLQSQGDWMTAMLGGGK